MDIPTCGVGILESSNPKVIENRSLPFGDWRSIEPVVSTFSKGVANSLQILPRFPFFRWIPQQVCGIERRHQFHAPVVLKDSAKSGNRLTSIEQNVRRRVATCDDDLRSNDREFAMKKRREEVEQLGRYVFSPADYLDDVCQIT